jgi:glucokinase-like ROK family protein
MVQPNLIPMGSSPSDVKSHNLSAVLLALRRHEYISRVRLAELTRLSTTTITNLVSELLAHGIVVEDSGDKLDHRRGVGRPRTALRLVPEARYALAVHIGVGRVRVAVADLRTHLLAHISQVHALEKSVDDVLVEIAGLVEEAIAESGIDRQYVVGMGVGVSGLVNPHTGVNILAPNLGWRGVPVRDWFTERFGLPVCVDNNVRAMALGEAMSDLGQDVRALAFVYARIGVGAGFVVDGQLYRGAGAGAGEIGHTTVIPDGGEPCRCGNTGCLETLISEPVIVRLAEELAAQDEHGILATCLRKGDGKPLERVFAAARAGDVAARHMLDERARYLGIALANLVNTFNPELIVLGGILAHGADLFLPVAEATMRQRSFANLGEQVQLRTTSFGWQAGVVGAAAMALDAFFYQQPEMD